jgi:hypothetical protein
MSQPKIRWTNVEYCGTKLKITNATLHWPGATDEELTSLATQFEAIVNIHEEPEATFETKEVNEDRSGEDAEANSDQTSSDTSV